MCRLSVLLTASLVAALLAGCGDDDEVPTTASQSPPPQSPPTATAAAPPALPGGRAAVDGRYRMRVRRTDYDGQNIVSRVADGDESTWPISTSCREAACRLDVRRELASGAFENLTLREVRESTYATSSTGATECIVGASGKVSSRQRLSLRVTGVEQIDGRPTAQRVDAYLTIRARCGDDPVRGVISWRGTRLP